MNVPEDRSSPWTIARPFREVRIVLASLLFSPTSFVVKHHTKDTDPALPPICARLALLALLLATWMHHPTDATAEYTQLRGGRQVLGARLLLLLLLSISNARMAVAFLSFFHRLLPHQLQQPTAA